MTNVAKKKKEQEKMVELGDALEIIDTSIKESFHIINDLLIWGKVQFGKLKVNSSSFNLFAFVNEIITVFSSVSDEKNICIKNNIPVDVFIKNDRDCQMVSMPRTENNDISWRFRRFPAKISQVIFLAHSG